MFDIANLTRLSGPLSIIYPSTGQAQYWGYNTTDGFGEISADGYFPETVGLLARDIIWVFLSDGGSPASYQSTILVITEIT